MTKALRLPRALAAATLMLPLAGCTLPVRTAAATASPSAAPAADRERRRPRRC